MNMDVRLSVSIGISFLQSLSHLIYCHEMIFTKFSKAMQSAKQAAPQALKDFGSLLIINLIVYFGLRLFFYIWNYGQLKSLSGLDLLKILWEGTIFDLAVIGPVCALLMIVWLWAPRILRWSLVFLLLSGHAFLILLSIADSVVINFLGRRFTINSMYLVGEGNTSNWFEFYQLFIFATVILTAYFYFTFKVLNRDKIKLKKIKFSTQVFLTLTFLGAAIIFGRGGFQSKPLSFINAKIINHPFAHQLVLNSGFTFVKSLGRVPIEKVSFYSQDEMLKRLNLDPSLFTKTEIQPEKLNVVLIMVESLSSEYLSPRITPFLDELSKKGVLFNPAFANGRRSVEGIAAVLSGIPSLMEESFINSEFATNDFVGLGTLLKTKDYTTSFFHGGKNGTMRFDSFTKAAGFEHYYGQNEFGDNSQDDGAWGIFDDPFLKYTCQQINNFKIPFASVIFTLSSHIPYHLPKDFQQKMNTSEWKNDPPILKSIHYTDEALRNFFHCAETQPWFNDTLFIIMADHTGPDLIVDSSFKSKFQIPILFFTKDIKKLHHLSHQQLAQQIDILPTLAELIGIPLLNKNHLARSLFQPGQKMIALYSDQRYEIVTDTDKSMNDDRLKAARQYFSEGLYDNRLYFPMGKGN